MSLLGTFKMRAEQPEGFALWCGGLREDLARLGAGHLGAKWFLTIAARSPSRLRKLCTGCLHPEATPCSPGANSPSRRIEFLPTGTQIPNVVIVDYPRVYFEVPMSILNTQCRSGFEFESYIGIAPNPGTDKVQVWTQDLNLA